MTRHDELLKAHRHVTITPHIPTADDLSALRAVEAGPLMLDLRSVELGYEYRSPYSATLNELFSSHGGLYIWDDEGFQIRGYLYVIQFDSGWVKVGWTVDPGDRLHKHAAHFYREHDGMKITRMWVSIPVLNPRNVESSLLSHARQLGDGQRFPRCTDTAKHGESEMYSGLDFEEMVGVASDLEVIPVTHEAAVHTIGLRRQTRYERQVVRALVKHLQGTQMHDGFAVPEPENIICPSASTAPLTDLDLTTREDLRRLLIRYKVGHLDPETQVTPNEQDPSPDGMWNRVRRLFKRA
ncbi:hypothetical protein [Rhodococcus sp. USK13]|uniref:hypothetical protein n=1 Tax=Rhodococcus sp. USK13 TaxID=2806442 RepID=UPI001BD0B000|nr:hypothetical protein [Rhodococcus sp. USK13]